MEDVGEDCVSGSRKHKLTRLVLLLAVVKSPEQPCVALFLIPSTGLLHKRWGISSPGNGSP